VPQGSTGDLGVVENLLHQLELLWLGIANEGLDNAWSAPYPIALLHHTRSATWLGPITSSGTVAISCVWSVGHALHCIHTVAACLTCIKCVVCPHVLQTHDGLDV
jgi:hypothetical protein